MRMNLMIETIDRECAAVIRLISDTLANNNACVVGLNNFLDEDFIKLTDTISDITYVDLRDTSNRDKLATTVAASLLRNSRIIFITGAGMEKTYYVSFLVGHGFNITGAGDNTATFSIVRTPATDITPIKTEYFIKY